MNRNADSTDSKLFLAQAKFHHSIRCSRTGKRVTFADVGDPNGPPVLYFLPSSCSRWLAVMLDELAIYIGVRLVAMDRPGSGGTEQCDLNDRVRVSGEMTESILDHLKIKEVMILAASGGTIHVMEYIRLHSDRLFRSHPSICLISPWIPGNSYLPWIPAPLIANVHNLLPTIIASEAVFSSSSAWISSWFSSRAPANNDEATPASSLDPTLGPISTPDRVHVETTSDVKSFPRKFLPKETLAVLQTYMSAEDHQGLSQEYLLCTSKGIQGKGKDQLGSREWYAHTINTLASHFGPEKGVPPQSIRPPRPLLTIEVWWGESDALIPREARDLLNGLLQASSAVQFRSRELPDADHDDPMLSVEGVGEALKLLKRQARLAGWKSKRSSRTSVQ